VVEETKPFQHRKGQTNSVCCSEKEMISDENHRALFFLIM
jgi:hypothetical protein